MSLTAEFLIFLSALVFGLRHGIDWDHIAAITDITGSQELPRQSLWLGTVYALGHGTVAVEMDPLSLLCRLASAKPPLGGRAYPLRASTQSTTPGFSQQHLPSGDATFAPERGE